MTGPSGEEMDEPNFEADLQHDLTEEAAVQRRMYRVWFAIVLLIVAWFVVKWLLGP